MYYYGYYYCRIIPFIINAIQSHVNDCMLIMLSKHLLNSSFQDKYTSAINPSWTVKKDDLYPLYLMTFYQAKLSTG